jgi:DNA-3-methyladenine glycosylase I
VPALQRCAWVPEGDPLYVAYHDQEWGVPSHDGRHLFELLVLEGAQAGLSWSTILRKREGYRRAFAGFDVERVARFRKRDVERLLGDSGIVRNRLKIESAVVNARATIEAGGLDELLWSFVDGRPLVNRWKTLARRDPGRDGRISRDVEGAEAARLPLRRPDDLLRADAGRRAGQRPHDRLFQARRSLGGRRAADELTWADTRGLGGDGRGGHH